VQKVSHSVGLPIGAIAVTDWYLSGFLAAAIKAPFPPMLKPMIERL
jgi:hypothetical protein